MDLKDRWNLNVQAIIVKSVIFIRYQDREILGYSVELSFFRDIRRYLNHLQKQG